MGMKYGKQHGLPAISPPGKVYNRRLQMQLAAQIAKTVVMTTAVLMLTVPVMAGNRNSSRTGDGMNAGILTFDNSLLLARGGNGGNGQGGGSGAGDCDGSGNNGEQGGHFDGDWQSVSSLNMAFEFLTVLLC